ncbi:MAG: hypothetical protein K1X67_26215 [Fimbriimonadaceae bacterium]|nr:hypothetical protein [Fimbriimonadaceae bacterium]
MKTLSRLMLVGLACAVGATAYAWNGYDFESGFGTSMAAHGPWAYGVKNSLLSTTLFLFTVPDSVTAGSATVNYWWFNDATYSRIYKNVSAVDANFGEGTIAPAGSIFLHPDVNRETCVRFSHLDPITYGFVYRWTRITPSNGSVVASVVENGTLRDSSVVSVGYSPGPWKYWTATFAAGLAMDFSVNQNGPPTHDSTRLECFAYEKSTTNLMLTLDAPEFVGDWTTIPVTVEFWWNKYPLPPITVYPNSAGVVFIPVPLRGTVQTFIKPSHWLRRQVVVFLTDSGLDIGQFAFINGDCDEDNEVGIGDYSILSGAYGTNVGDAGFVTNADLNGDDAVDIADYAILSSNYGLAGD